MLGNAKVLNPTGHWGLAAFISCLRASRCLTVGVRESPSAVRHSSVAPHRSMREPSWSWFVSFSTLWQIKRGVTWGYTGSSVMHFYSTNLPGRSRKKTRRVSYTRYPAPASQKLLQKRLMCTLKKKIRCKELLSNCNNFSQLHPYSTPNYVTCVKEEWCKSCFILHNILDCSLQVQSSSPPGETSS